MSKTILSHVDGWTPVINSIVLDVGLMSAVVFGRMWRYCQMSDGVCKASLETVSKEIGVDKATVQRHAKKLCDHGYLKDLTPELRNRPHVYVDTGKASLQISITVAESNAKGETVAESNATVAESQLNKDSNKENKNTYKPNRKEAKERIAKQRAERGSRDPVKVMIEGLQEVQPNTEMRLRIETALKLNLAREWDLPKSEWSGYDKLLLKREQETGQTIEQFIEWYNADEFRRNGNIWLKPNKIEQLWPRAFEQEEYFFGKKPHAL